MLKRIFLAGVFFIPSLFAQDLKSNYEQILELSPDSNIPQNKNLQNTLKTQKEYEILQKDKKAFEKEIKIKKSKNEKEPSTEYVFHITNKGVSIKDLNINEEELKELVRDFLDTITIEKLQDISNVVSYFFQINGYPAATVYLPQQALNREKIEFEISLGVLGEYIVKNQTGVRDYAIEGKLNNKIKGKIITTKAIEDSIYKINEMYGLNAVASLQAGKHLGQTDILIEVSNTQTVQALMYADNYGIKESGSYRGGVSFSLNNLARMGDNLNLFLQSSDEKQINYGLSYTNFINNLKITPSISQSSYSLGGIYKNAGFSGTSKNVGLELSYPLWINTLSSFYLTSSFYHKKLSDSRMNDLLTIDKSSNVFSFGFEGVYRGFESNSLSYKAFISVGDVKDEGTTIFGIINQKTGGNGFGKFAKFNASVNNYYFFNEFLVHTMTLNLQKVLGGFELDSSEQSSLGGPYGVRAYNNGEGEGDNTFVASLGLRIQIPKTNFYFTPFYDIGYAWYENDYSTNYRSTDKHFLDALGVQILYFKNNAYYVKIDLARALHKYKFDTTHRNKAYISTGWYF